PGSSSRAGVRTSRERQNRRWRRPNAGLSSEAMPEQTPRRSLVEGRIVRSGVDESREGKPLSRRARQTQRSVEAYLSAGVLPRYMERLREIDASIRRERRRLERAYRIVRETCGPDRELFARQWRARARAWPFEHVNELIRE